MSEFRPAHEAEAEIDDVWLHCARARGGIGIAARVVNSQLFLALRAAYLYGPAADQNLRSSLRRFPMVRGSRDIRALFRP